MAELFLRGTVLLKHLPTGNHLDVGVGTGYFLDQCQFPSTTPRIALMDLNTNTLEFAAQRITRYSLAGLPNV